MSEAAASNDVVDTLLSVREGDRLALEAEQYDWASPFEVDAIDEEPFEAPNGGVWKARRVTLASTARRGSDREVDVYPAAPAPDIGPGYGRLVSAEPVDEDEGGTSTEGDTTSDVDSESEAETDALAEDAADDDAGDHNAGDGVQEEPDDPDPITVDAVDDADDDQEVELPDGVTERDVDELTSGQIEIGELADELGVSVGRARLIAHHFGYYSRVREVKRRDDRAQVDPRVAGLLVVALGLVATGLLVIGVTAP